MLIENVESFCTSQKVETGMVRDYNQTNKWQHSNRLVYACR